MNAVIESRMMLMKFTGKAESELKNTKTFNVTLKKKEKKLRGAEHRNRRMKKAQGDKRAMGSLKKGTRRHKITKGVHKET